ncbi:hypothetical protein QTH90_13425 [Variovorax sp. J2P1-59]|uniref:hypothetical protein n=1 Tax=Variovorax flavidus TaxID=3053501 RepID=UPI0025764D6A|nr:hypothetical protein [Variovorax sp. J2P1-59]MDM0075395.1 hypothetical protein [Variovorax sp. J2P1-59]
MAHPTCALARPPDFPFAEDDPGYSGSLAAELVGHINALKEMHEATVCLRGLVDSWRAAGGRDSGVSPKEVQALLKMVHAEYDRRLKASLVVTDAFLNR